MTTFSIPTVDISPYLKSATSPEAFEVVRSIREACITSGFFQIVDHGIPRTLQESVFECAKLIFDLPLDEKLKLRSANGRGYETIGGQTLEPGMKADMKEGYYVGLDIVDDQSAYKDFRYPNRWPAPSLIPDNKFKMPLLDYQARLCDLSQVMMEVLGKGLPYGDAGIFDSFCESPLAVVRLLHYPPQPDLDDPKQLGAGAHTDFGAITLLLQDDNGGLEVLNEKTGDWINVVPNPDAYVVNVGDMLQKWTKGEYKSNVHRVINRTGSHRYSVPFFFDGNLDYVLKPLDGSEDEGITVEAFMRERFARTYKS